MVLFCWSAKFTIQFFLEYFLNLFVLWSEINWFSIIRDGILHRHELLCENFSLLNDIFLAIKALVNVDIFCNEVSQLFLKTAWFWFVNFVEVYNNFLIVLEFKCLIVKYALRHICYRRVKLTTSKCAHFEQIVLCLCLNTLFKLETISLVWILNYRVV